MQDSKIFKRKPNLLRKPLYNAPLLSLFWFAMLDLLHCFSQDSFCSLLGQDDFPSQTCFLPIYIEAIFLSGILPGTILAFLLRDRLNWREADQKQPQRTIFLNGLYLSLGFFTF